VQRLHDALGFTPPAASDHVRQDDLVVVELLQQTLLAVYRRHRQHVWVDHSIGHLERILEPLGPVELKGVAQPLEVFRAGAGPAARSGPGASRW
jgi:class 3 adenylate cyclase